MARRHPESIPPPDQVAMHLSMSTMVAMTDFVILNNQVNAISKWLMGSHMSSRARVEYGMQLMDAQILLETLERSVGGDFSDILLRCISSMRKAEEDIRATEPDFAKIDRYDYREAVGGGLTDQVAKYIKRERDFVNKGE